MIGSALLIGLVAHGPQAMADDDFHTAGVGVTIGGVDGVVGLTGKYYLNRRNGVGAYAGVGYSYYGLTFRARAAWEGSFWASPPEQTWTGGFSVNYLVSLGGTFTTGYYQNIGVTVLAGAGVSYFLPRFPLEFFLQLHFGIDVNLVNSYYSLLSFQGGLGLGIRYAF